VFVWEMSPHGPRTLPVASTGTVGCGDGAEVILGLSFPLHACALYTHRHLLGLLPLRASDTSRQSNESYRASTRFLGTPRIIWPHLCCAQTQDEKLVPETRTQQHEPRQSDEGDVDTRHTGEKDRPGVKKAPFD
jgi:hypothetical protein